MSENPFQPFVAARGFAVIDGGLATTLEARGHVLDPILWSAKLLQDDPASIRDVHRAFLEAGADCITTVSYQASVPGFARVGVDESTAVALLRRSSELALSARDEHVADRLETDGGALDLRPRVAASIGPYGAYLADGSEYDGRYGVGRGELDAFHRRRAELLASTGVDLLACETIPSRLEAEVLLDILDDLPDEPWAWLSFSCADGSRIHDGTPIEEAVALCEGHDRIAAVGVNCTTPEHVPELVGRARAVTDRYVIAYPNSGEAYDAVSGTWASAETADGTGGDVPRGGHERRAGVRGADARDGGAVHHGSWLSRTLAARDSGARIVGGCCRVRPEEIAELRRRLST